MSTSVRRPSSRDKLLDAAASLVAEHGVHNLTIEAVAATAGVTKAGLIYHFKTRDDLLSALVERMMQEVDVLSRHMSSPKEPTVSLQASLRQLIDMTFDMPERQKTLLKNLLQANASHPHLIEPAQKLFMRSYAELGRGTESGLALLLAVAMDGLLLIDLLQLHQFTAAQRKVLRKSALELAQKLS
ncbi:TetR/AcrR family transcriptional regulator [Variovorax boronicumulans]|uniref:TetR/AcrR family transcriptional regulator n=1 Tax=Variovorax boronicumulans TaxID=436515 RepID=UPI0007825C00|nr:TetR/AcrR family transcriptional regulator [Variovorax boronicumulans]